MSSFLRQSVLCAAIFFSASGAVFAGDVTPIAQGELLFKNVCSTCHGPQGQGTESLRVPTIAARPAWYVERQIENFRAGRRGQNAAEPQALIMGIMAKALKPEQIKGVAMYIQSLALVPPLIPDDHSPTDVALGKELFQMRCMECHRFNATGEMTFGSPPLVGLPPWYMMAQIRKFKSGERGAVPGDQFGAKMVLSARFIESEEDLRSVMAYILTLNPPPDPLVQADALFKEAPLSANSNSGAKAGQ